MAFLEQRMTAQIERGAQVSICNRGRTKVYASSGRLRQVFKWSTQLHEFNVSPGIATLSDYESLRALWYVVNFTPYEGFRFRHHADYRAARTNTVVTSLGGGSYQLYRRYTVAGINFDRKITKPNSDAVLYDSGGSALTATISTTTGIATSVSGTPAAWSGTFDVPVTFVDDTFPEELETTEGGTLVISRAIRLEELRQ